ncbi:MAG TPA: hypothetical protein VG319_15095, partial [Polyangia bacterium]|nr:hypothetical protein [Polyangia bacterium]
MTAPRTRVAAVATLALVSACTKKEACRPGSVLLTLTFDAAAMAATQVDLTTTVNGGVPKPATIPHAIDRAQLTVEIDLSAYEAGATYTVSAAAGSFGDSKTSTLQPGCSQLLLALGGAPVSCGASTHVCGGVCVANTDPMTCGTRCDACPLPDNADLATCDSVTCGFTCKAGHHRCGAQCLDDTSPQSCGASCSACVAPAGGTATCDGTTCGGACPDGQKLCAGTCISQAT